MSKQLEDFVQVHRSEFDSLEPSAEILKRIQTQIEPSAKKQVLVIPIRFIRMAVAAVIIVLAGFGVYRLLVPNTPVSDTASQVPAVNKTNDTPNEQTFPKAQETIPVKPTQTSKESTARFVLINENIAKQKTALFAKMNNMESASERYSAMVNAVDAKKIDRDIINALLQSMNNDPNSNVRLAAMESLSKFYKEPYVKKNLIKSMSTQKDPIVQMALIDLLTKMRTTSIVDELKKITEDSNTPKPVKDQAYSSIFKLTL